MNPANTVIGIARSPDAVKAKVSADNLPSNVHILKGDLTDPESLNTAASETSKITGGAVDYLIINGAYLPYTTAHLTASDYKGKEQEFLELLNASMHANVAGVIFTVNAFIDLVKNSNVKKVIVISSGMADEEIILKAEIAASVPYSISKAGANVVTSKYAAQYKKDGVIFLSLSPGFVQTQADPNEPGECGRLRFRELTADMGNSVPPELAAAQDALTEAFRKYEPNFKGIITPEESVDLQLKVIEGITLKESGQFLSHKGTRRFL